MTIHYDKNDFEKLKKKVEKHDELLKKIQSDNIQETLDKNIMEDNERTVFKFVKEHEGTNKENIIFNLKAIGSRKTIFKILRSLKNKGYILDQLNVNNGRRRSIFVNNNNMVLKVEEELTEFKDKLFIVLDKLEKFIAEGKQNTSNHQYDKVIEYLREDYFKFISIYFFRALLQWHNHIADKQVIFLLYSQLINNIMAIQERISMFVQGFVPAIPFYKEICTDDDDFPIHVKEFSYLDLEEEYHLLTNSLSKINSTYSKGNQGLN